MGFMRENQEQRAFRFLVENGRASAADLGRVALLSPTLPAHAAEDVGRAIGCNLVRQRRAKRQNGEFVLAR
jgi:hypothetical protein